MPELAFIQDFAVVILVAGVAGWLCQRVGLSVVVGYLAAGIIVGPATPPFSLVSGVASIETLAQLGLVFLMFSIGMRLSFRRLQRLAASLLLATFLGAIGVYYLTRLGGSVLGWSTAETLFFAGMLMCSSSAIIGKVLQETGTTHERPGQLAMGITVLEDVVAIVMLTVLASYTALGGGEATPAPLGETLGRLGAFVVLVGVGGLLIVPWLLRKLSLTASDELQTLGLVGVLFAWALLARNSGYSLALGAFLFGAIVAETTHRHQADRTLEGMRDVFTAVFFVAIGMQIDVTQLVDIWWLVLLLTAFTIIARASAVTLGLIVIGTPRGDALRASLAVTPLGEFSFIIAQLGLAAAVVPEYFYPMAVGISLLTTLGATGLTRHAGGISAWLLAREPRWLGTWFAFYQGRVERLHRLGQGNPLWQLNRKRLLHILLELVLVTGLVLFAESQFATVVAWLEPRFGDTLVPVILFWALLGLVVLVPLVAIWRNLSALALLHAEVLTVGLRSEARPLLEFAFKLLIGLMLYLWLALLLPTDGARWVLPVSALVIVLVLVLLRRRFVYWHSTLEVELRDRLQSGGDAFSALPDTWLASHGDWQLHVVECVLPDHAQCGGQTIAGLALRSRHGCSIVGIERQGIMLSLPAPHEVLYPRDKLLLLGTTPQIQAGKAVLQAILPDAKGEGSEFDEVRMELVAVPPESHVQGQTLAGIGLAQNHRVQIAGIQRNGRRVLNPAGNESLHGDDQLLVLGTPQRIRDFRAWVQTPTPPPS